MGELQEGVSTLTHKNMLLTMANRELQQQNETLAREKERLEAEMTSKGAVEVLGAGLANLVLQKETHSPDKGLLRGALLKELENFKDRSVVESQTVELSLKTITNLLALLRAHA